jgi:hypothetical protein
MCRILEKDIGTARNIKVEALIITVPVCRVRDKPGTDYMTIHLSSGLSP